MSSEINVSLDNEVLAQDFDACAAYGTPETEIMMNDEDFSRIKKMAYVFYISRSILVDEDAIEEAGQCEFHDKSARRISFFMLKGGVLSRESLGAMAWHAAEFGWHIQLQMDERFLHECEAELLSLPCTLVIDYNGKFLEPVALNHLGAVAPFRLLDSGLVWVKTSCFYETSRSGPPVYEGVSVLAWALIDEVPESCVWATNWTHAFKPDSPPDDGHLLDLALTWGGFDHSAQQIFVDNPGFLYGFEREGGTA